MAALGIGAAVAVAAVTTATVSACATTPAQTLADNGSPIATVPEASSCTTVTYTVPTVTQTVTQTVTTTAAPAPTFESVTGWARPSPATPAAAQAAGWRLVPFTTKAGLDSAIAGMQGHDFIYYSGTGVLTIAASGNGNAYTLANKNPALPVVIDFGTMKSVWNPSAASGNYVQFAYNGTAAYDAMWLHDDSNLDIYGGEFIGTGARAGILIYGATHNLVWDDFVADHVAGAGMQETPVNGDIHDVTVRGEVYAWAQNPAVDDHPDKGTGLHALLIENSGTSSHNFFNNTSAIYGHDPLAPSSTWPEGAGGSVIEIGNSNSANNLNGNTLYAKGVNLGMTPNGTNPGSTSTQTGGNVINLWGRTPDNGLTIGWVEGSNTTGADVHCTSDTWDTASPAVIVLHGRATNTNLYTGGGNGVPNNVPYPAGFNIVYQDVLP